MIATTFNCSCNHPPAEIIFDKIKAYTGSTRRHVCPKCGSEYIIKILKVKDKYKVFVKNEFISPQLRAIIDAAQKSK